LVGYFEDAYFRAVLREMVNSEVRNGESFSIARHSGASTGARRDQ
jgi:hypothetical protein